MTKAFLVKIKNKFKRKKEEEKKLLFRGFIFIIIFFNICFFIISSLIQYFILFYFLWQGEEWHERAKKLEEMSKNVNRLFQKLNSISNKELMYELYPYIWEMRAVISTLNSYINWLGNKPPSSRPLLICWIISIVNLFNVFVGTRKAGQTSENPAVGNYTCNCLSLLFQFK